MHYLLRPPSRARQQPRRLAPQDHRAPSPGPRAPPLGRSDPDLHSTQNHLVVSVNTLETRPRLRTLDCRLGTQTLEAQDSRLKTEGPAVDQKSRAPPNSPTPPTRTTPAESIGCFCRSVVVSAAAAAPFCWGWVHGGLQSALPPPTPCTAKVLGCVVQHGRYSAVTMAPCSMESGGTWSRCALHSDISINFKAALPTHHCMSGIAKACSALLCCDIYSTCTPRYTHSRGALPPKRAQ